MLLNQSLGTEMDVEEIARRMTIRHDRVKSGLGPYVQFATDGFPGELGINLRRTQDPPSGAT